ncbi:MAG: hypothetical protein GXY32_00840 [Ruminococcaceae bacterium]|nr:hypothetical protein [Oscillospiraceae bacterium]
MTIFRNSTENNLRFKPESKNSEPFPPSYYENEKRAKVLINQMTTKQWKLKPND